jgi:predicted transcriptional regulator of viral defense system
MGKLVDARDNQPRKTVGAQSARLLTALHDRSQSMFTLAEAAKITGLSRHLASSLLHKAAKRGLVYRVKPGLFTIVPAELGSAVEFANSPYLVAQRLAGSAPCFISHASAMEIHRMVTQPQLVFLRRAPNALRAAHSTVPSSASF